MKNQQSSLPRYPVRKGLQRTTQEVVRFVRELGDVGIVKSYFLLVWSEWNWVYSGVFYAMLDSLGEDFGGIGMRNDRRDLIARLDRVLGQLDRGLEYLRQHDSQLRDDHVQVSKERYGRLKAKLLKLDSEEASTFPIMRLPSQFVPTKH
jgi:hypothetical protein